MRKILKLLLVIQEVSNEGRSSRFSKESVTVHRLNPYNPLSYITFIVALAIGIVLFGFIGVWDQVDTKNPFKWN